MDVAAHIGELRTNGELLAAAADRAGLDRAIPPCPGWQMRDLLQHIGMVHRWAAANVTRANGRAMTDDEQREAVGPYPADAQLTGWFRDGHAALVRALAAAGPDVPCWTFLPAPSPLAFWARRQAHETTIHRVDAESADGAITPVAAPLAADGIDELLTGFAPRARYRLRADPPRTLAVHATDTGTGSAAAGAGAPQAAPARAGDWVVRAGPERVETFRRSGAADCVIRGAAADLYLLLWNRRESIDGVEMTGDPAVLTWFREKLRVRWS
jgi:uncharacterized protein (TIGR03083 family)